ncbi:MAG: hypothetical protein Q9228_001047 [Teloschistes exilis]
MTLEAEKEEAQRKNEDERRRGSTAGQSVDGQSHDAVQQPPGQKGEVIVSRPWRWRQRKKEEEAQGKNEDERQRGSTAGQSVDEQSHDAAQAPPGQNYAPGARPQLPPIGYAPAGDGAMQPQYPNRG